MVCVSVHACVRACLCIRARDSVCITVYACIRMRVTTNYAALLLCKCCFEAEPMLHVYLCIDLEYISATHGTEERATILWPSLHTTTSLNLKIVLL